MPYYDHDPIWHERAVAKNPVWGSNSLRVYSELLSLLQRFAPAPARLFDVGCGAGAFGRYLGKAGYTYVGADASAAAIALGREYFPDLDLRVIDFALDAPSLDAIDAANFDVVTAVNSLHCLVQSDERARFLRRMRWLAKPRGFMALTTMCAPVGLNLRPSALPRLYASVGSLKKELEACGWTSVCFEHLEPANAQCPVSNLYLVASC